jgi:hypothetical protein
VLGKITFESLPIWERESDGGKCAKRCADVNHESSNCITGLRVFFESCRRCLLMEREVIESTNDGGRVLGEV